MPLDSPPKDPVKVRAGMIGARVRWRDHRPRVVKLDQLDADTARLIRALLAQRPTEEAATTDENVVTAREAQRVRAELPTAS